ncbi:transcriptional regulator [Thermoanaerobacter sp. YS13]|uniref:helix-turn-helix domain-containing protein n=1 Tax=Thermoanaerobacter sp. YS13 TaxID=1511746 RepID=UPI0005733EDD|nr:helix-turn-helix transcriptional regulator [Thermoanaerobacter sp. YS13]KHO62700.1 transcriptional regulator [Thermoanaerobacter sp. YS13]
MAYTKLRLLRKAKGLTQLQLAAMTGIHIPEIYKLERGLLRPYPVWKERIAAAFDYPLDKVDELFEIVENSDE